MPKSDHYSKGYVCSKDRMLRGLPGYSKPNNRMVRLMVIRRRIEELELQREVKKFALL